MNILRFVPRFSGAAEAVGRACARSFRIPEAAELVFLPFVLFRYSIETEGHGGKRKTESGLVMVDLVQGPPMNIPAGTVFALDEGASADWPFPASSPPPGGKKAWAPVRAGFEDIPSAQVIPALLGSEAAIGKGKKLLRYDLMRLAGGLRYRKWELVIHPGRTVIHYPFWLVYHRDRRRNVRLSVMDGLNGRREGGEVALSIEKGLLEKKYEEQNLRSRA